MQPSWTLLIGGGGFYRFEERKFFMIRGVSMLGAMMAQKSFAVIKKIIMYTIWWRHVCTRLNKKICLEWELWWLTILYNDGSVRERSVWLVYRFLIQWNEALLGLHPMHGAKTYAGGRCNTDKELLKGHLNFIGLVGRLWNRIRATEQLLSYRQNISLSWLTTHTSRKIKSEAGSQ